MGIGHNTIKYRKSYILKGYYFTAKISFKVSSFNMQMT